MSGVTIVKVRSEVAASNADRCRISAFTVSITRRTGSASASARGVGFISCPVRTNSGSPNRVRSRASAALVAGWLKPTASAARVTLWCRARASNTTSRFRSIDWISMAWMESICRIH